MRCHEVMERDVQTCCADDPVVRVAELMRDHAIGFVPVCDRDGRPLGAITDRDLAVRVVAEPSRARPTAAEVMTREVVACDPDDDLAEAARLMVLHRKYRVMCVAPSGRLVGVISMVDVATVESDDTVAAGLLRAVARRDACFELWR